jgi:hypothetical protein
MLRLRLIEKKHAFFLIAHQFKNDEQWKALGSPHFTLFRTNMHIGFFADIKN